MCSAKRPPIKLIATDVDGTLLNSKQELTPAVEQAIKKAADLGVPVIFCLSIDTYRQKGASQSLLHIDDDASFNNNLYSCSLSWPLGKPLDAHGQVKLHQQSLGHRLPAD